MATRSTDRDHADLITANRALIRRMRTRDYLVKRMAQAERDLTEARKLVLALIDRLKHPDPEPYALCPACGLTLGTTPTCLNCQALSFRHRPLTDARAEDA